LIIICRSVGVGLSLFVAFFSTDLEAGLISRLDFRSSFLIVVYISSPNQLIVNISNDNYDIIHSVQLRLGSHRSSVPPKHHVVMVHTPSTLFNKIYITLSFHTLRIITLISTYVILFESKACKKNTYSVIQIIFVC
jgi:hypothetical protein